MKIYINYKIKWWATLLLLVSFLHPTFACPIYPCRPIRIVVPVEPGGGIDSMARLLAQVFSVRLKTEVMVLNKPGAFGGVGTAWVASTANDGYTLLVTGLNHTSTALLSERPLYDAVQDFVPIAKIAEAPNLMLVNSELPVNNVADVARLSRQRAKGLTFAAIGGSTRIAAELFQQRTGGKWVHIPFKGSPQALRSTIAGDTDLVFVNTQLAQAALDSGRVKALAITHPKRVDYMPAIPTLRELGFEDADSSQWYGILAPAGTPASVIDTLENAIRQELMPEGMLQKYIQSNRLEYSYLAKQDFKVFLQDQTKRIRLLNIDINN